MTLVFTPEITIWILIAAYLFSPGWLLIVWLFPDEHPVWQIIVGGGLGVALLGLIALLLSYLPAGITPGSILVASIALSVLSAVSLCRRLECACQQLSCLLSSLGLRGKLNWKDHISPALTLLSFAAFLVAALFLSQGRRESFTEFYVVDGLQQAPPWRRPISASDPVSLVLAVVSHERTTESFQVHILTNGQTFQVISLGALEPGADVQHSVTIPPRTSSAQQYTLVLCKDGSGVPYRTLHFWLHVPPAVGPHNTAGKSTAR